MKILRVFLGEGQLFGNLTRVREMSYHAHETVVCNFGDLWPQGFKTLYILGMKKKMLNMELFWLSMSHDDDS